MAEAVIMPQVGQDIETAKIVEWFCDENDTVKQGNVIASVESDKATFDIEAPCSGTVIKILFPAGEEGEVLKPIAYIGEKGETINGAEPQKVDIQEPKPIDDSLKTTAEPVSVPDTGRIFASPAAKRIAKEKNIEISEVQGSGPRGRIVKKDILEFKSNLKHDTQSVSPIQRADIDKEVPFSKMREKIAEKLSQSKREIPHFYLTIEADVTEILKKRKNHNQKYSQKISINDVIIHASAKSLEKFPKMNSSIDHNKLIIKDSINIAIAVATDDGLLVPVIPGANQKKLDEIAEYSRKIAEAARQGKMLNFEKSSFSISNLGAYSIDAFFPIINPPEVAILGVGTAKKKVVPVDDGSIGIRSMMNLSLSCDHRAVDGAYAAEFLSCLKELLETFEF